MREDDFVLMCVESRLSEPDFTARLLAMLKRRGLAKPERAMIHAHRARAARLMLDAGMSTTDTVEALQVRFSVSRASAYRIIRKC